MSEFTECGKYVAGTSGATVLTISSVTLEIVTMWSLDK